MNLSTLKKYGYDDEMIERIQGPIDLFFAKSFLELSDRYEVLKEEMKRYKALKEEFRTVEEQFSFINKSLRERIT